MSNTKTPARGILLIALGSPQYGCYAANLAASIRYNDPDLPIHLVHTEDSVSHLAAEHRALFSSMQLCPADAYTMPATCQPAPANPIQYIRAKTWMYDLSPYAETLFLDVDTMILPGHSMAALLEELAQQCDFTIENRGYADLSTEKSLADYSVWCNVEDLRSCFSTEIRKSEQPLRYFNLHSELVYFKKNKANKKFFDKVKRIYDAPPVRATQFDTGLSDEFAFSTAMMLLQHYPHRDYYIRIYWSYAEKEHDWYTHVTKNFLAFSLGGNMLRERIKARVTAYNNLFRQKLGLPYLFTPHHKKVWNKHRERM